MKNLTRAGPPSAPPGLERVIFARLPRWLAAGTLLPLCAALLTRLLPLPGSAGDVARTISRVDIFAIASVITTWAAVFTIAIGCVVVIVMKGPRFIADSCPVDEEQRRDLEATADHGNRAPNRHA